MLNKRLVSLLDENLCKLDRKVRSRRALRRELRVDIRRQAIPGHHPLHPEEHRWADQYDEYDR